MSTDLPDDAELISEWPVHDTIQSNSENLVHGRTKRQKVEAEPEPAIFSRSERHSELRIGAEEADVDLKPADICLARWLRRHPEHARVDTTNPISKILAAAKSTAGRKFLLERSSIAFPLVLICQTG